MAITETRKPISIKPVAAKVTPTGDVSCPADLNEVAAVAAEGETLTLTCAAAGSNSTIDVPTRMLI